jgi:hypothetical protein
MRRAGAYSTLALGDASRCPVDCRPPAPPPPCPTRTARDDVVPLKPLVALLALLAPLLLLAPRAAFAEAAATSASSSADVRSPSTIEAAQAAFDEAAASALDTDCALSCRALESMRRAADRLCALDPGDRCAKARAKVAEAMARVRAACPDCAVARDEQRPPEPANARVTDEIMQTRRRGGCAGCEVGADRESAPWAALLSAVCLASFFVRRRARPR